MKLLLAYGLGITLFSLSGCRAKSYVATSNYAPNLRYAGDYEVSAGAKIRFTPFLPAPEINAAFSPFPHIGILGSYRRDFKNYYPDYRDISPPTNPYLRQELGEVGIGYYYLLKNQYGLALYGGYTAGALQRRDDVKTVSNPFWTDDLNIRFHRYWLMAYATLLRAGTQQAESGLGVKISRQVFDEYQSVTGLPNQENYVGQGFNSVEPFLYGRIGEKAHQFHVQIGFAFPQNEKFAEPSYAHLSVQYVFARPYKKQKKQAWEADKHTP